MTDLSEDVDGRRLRRSQNRDAVLDALVSLFEEGLFQPSSGEIAARAGLSPRSLFRYFDDVDDLNRAAIERQQERARPLLDVHATPSEPTNIKIDRFVEARVRLYETIRPSARAARVCAHRHPVVAAQIKDGRAYLRHQLSRLFAPELTGDHGGVLPALDALCSFETYELLRSDQGLSGSKIITALNSAVSALLNSPGGTS